MPLTKDFKTLVLDRAQKDPEFRIGLLKEAMDAMLNGDLALGKSMLRDYVNATTGFDELAAEMDKNKASLMRMLSDKGNPRAENLFSMVAALQKHEGIQLGTSVIEEARP